MSEELVLTATEAAPADADIAAAKRILEAVLLSTQEPLSLNELRRVFDNELSAETLRRALDELRGEWQDRGVELVQVATGWRFQTRLEYQKFIERLRTERAPRYSRAVMETLAIIAYRQPVTRGDIEDIRGVSVSSQILKTLEARGWIDIVGHKEVPGRPALYATTKALLDDLNLRSLQELPPLTQLEELEARAAGAELTAADAELTAASEELTAASGTTAETESTNEQFAGAGTRSLSETVTEDSPLGTRDLAHSEAELHAEHSV